MNSCKNCGSKISFVPSVKGNKCENCGSVFEAEYIYNFVKKSFNSREELKVDNFAKNIKSLKCNSCGATMVLNKLETQSSCPYCGNTSIIADRKNKLMYIDSVIPFSFSKEEALKKFKSTLSSRAYAKKSIYSGVTVKDINGLYVNTFVFDMDVIANYSGIFSYTKTVKDSEGNTKFETVNKHVSGTYYNTFNNVTVEASSHIQQSDLKSVMPFDYSQAVDFKEDFMNGYILEYENSMFDNCVKTAEDIIRKKIESDLLTEHCCTRIVSLNMKIDYTDKKYNYCLLPFYKLSKTYQGENCDVFINGQTGKVGKTPTSVGKILLTIFGILGIVLGFLLLAFFVV